MALVGIDVISNAARILLKFDVVGDVLLTRPSNAISSSTTSALLTPKRHPKKNAAKNVQFGALASPLFTPQEE